MRDVITTAKNEASDPRDAIPVSLNLHRRHLSVGQRAMIAAKMANLKHGSNRFEKAIEAPSGVSTKPLISVGKAADWRRNCHGQRFGELTMQAGTRARKASFAR